MAKVNQTRPYMPTLDAIRSAAPGQLSGYHVAEALDGIANMVNNLAGNVNGITAGVTNITQAIQSVQAATSSSVQTQPPDQLSFAALVSGANIQATMNVDTGSSLIPVDSGVVGANELFNVDGVLVASVSGAAPTHPGEVLISQPDGSAAFADPLVQGLYPAGSSITSPPAYAAPTTIQPVLVGGSDYAGSPVLRDIKVDSSGNIYIGGTVTVVGTGTFAVQAAQSGSWTVAATQDGTWTVDIAAGQTIAVTNTGTFAVQAAQSGSWTVAATQSGTWTIGVTQSGTWNIDTLTSITDPVAVTQSGSWTVAATQSGTWNIGTLTSITDDVTVVGTGTFAVQAAQTGSWTVAATQSGTWSVDQGGSWTVAATQSGTWTVDIAAGQTIAVTNTGTFAVQDAAAEASLATLAGTVTAGAVAVTAASLPLPTGAATNAGAANGNSNQVSVASTATEIVSSRTTRRAVKITNLGTTDVYLGFSSGVTTATGDLLVGVKGAFVSLPTTSAVYGIVGSGSQSVSFIEVYD